MGMIGDIVIIILLIIVGYYQSRKIGSLEKQIKSQKGILESADTFFKLFDLEKLKGYAEIREEKVRMEKDIEFSKFKQDFEEKIKKQDADKFPELISIINAFFDALTHLPSEVRNKVIERMGEGELRSQ